MEFYDCVDILINMHGVVIRQMDLFAGNLCFFHGGEPILRGNFRQINRDTQSVHFGQCQTLQQIAEDFQPVQDTGNGRHILGKIWFSMCIGRFTGENPAFDFILPVLDDVGNFTGILVAVGLIDCCLGVEYAGSNFLDLFQYIWGVADDAKDFHRDTSIIFWIKEIEHAILSLFRYIILMQEKQEEVAISFSYTRYYDKLYLFFHMDTIIISYGFIL